ncbi:MAG: hypothetical protein IJT28_02875 [Bacteroidaceae bacterium]|nr:hypothetical protein [Bacteroidaceae bacterium]
MKKKSTNKGLLMVGSLRKSGMTFYLRQGQVVVRTAHSDQKRSMTRPQFIQRQKMRHTMALWKMLKYCDLTFTQSPTAYRNFASLANRMQAVYVPDNGVMKDASFLMPGIPVSDGTLPTVKLELGEVNGVPALLTDLKTEEWSYDDELMLYTAVQCIELKMPRVRFSMCKVSWDELTVVDGRYALVNEGFADEMKGWALVRVQNYRCSPQTIITRCTLYQQYTTEEALEIAADSYGGLTERL